MVKTDAKLKYQIVNIKSKSVTLRFNWCSKRFLRRRRWLARFIIIKVIISHFTFSLFLSFPGSLFPFFCRTKLVLFFLNLICQVLLWNAYTVYNAQLLTTFKNELFNSCTESCCFAFITIMVAVTTTTKHIIFCTFSVSRHKEREREREQEGAMS